MDTCFFGSMYLANKKKIYKSFGNNPSEIYFMRSLAKPLQTSILFDCNIIGEYKITNPELAIFSGSHSGSDRHIAFLKDIFKKYKLKEKDLLIKPIEPLDKRKFKGKAQKLHNNCSGKHTMMLLMCKYLNLKADYTNPNHPLQEIIKEKQEKLSQYKSDILTYDGCTTPLWGLPCENIIAAYFNLIKKHPALINAIVNNSYLYGGYNRFDTEIIKLSNKKLFAKVGAGGLVLVYNREKEEILLVKMAQDNNEARRTVTLDYLKKLNWLDFELDKNIYNQKKQIVAKYEFSL
ncbi:MAG: asparaginase [Candidatus Gastranaerophilales bacterium]|nr:asparaginase [Candidatus Gastranaerophilales bacterium]